MAEAGEKAPDFELNDQNQSKVRLTDFRGKKVLIAFFPFAFSPVCSDELGCFEAELDSFSDKVQILGISVDSHWSNKAFSEKLGLHYPLLSDFDRSVCRAYGVLRKDGFADRAYFIVDGHGIITYKHVMASPGERLQNSELLKEVM